MHHARGDVGGPQHREHGQQVGVPPRGVDLLHLVAQRLQGGRRLAGAALALGVELSLDGEVERQRHPQLAGIALGQLGERRLGRRRPGGVAGLGAGHHVEQGRGVGGGAGEGSVGGQEVVAEVGRPGDAPALDLEAHQSAAGGGDPDRADAVAGVRGRHRAACHGTRGAAARPAGGALWVPGIARRAEAARLGNGQDPELRRLSLADEHEPGLAEAAYERVVVVRRKLPEKVRSLRHTQPRHRREQVLDRDRHAAEGAIVAGLHLAGGGQGAVRVHVHPRVQPAVYLLDARERCLHELARGELTGAHQGGQLGGRPE